MMIVTLLTTSRLPGKPVARASQREITPSNIKDILRIIKLRPRDRPTVEELLVDVWFTETSPDTQDPLPRSLGNLRMPKSMEKPDQESKIMIIC